MAGKDIESQNNWYQVLACTSEYKTNDEYQDKIFLSNSLSFKAAEHQGITVPLHSLAYH